MSFFFLFFFCFRSVANSRSCFPSSRPVPMLNPTTHAPLLTTHACHARHVYHHAYKHHPPHLELVSIPLDLQRFSPPPVVTFHAVSGTRAIIAHTSALPRCRSCSRFPLRADICCSPRYSDIYMSAHTYLRSFP